MSGVQPRWHRTRPKPQASCPRPLGKRLLLCLPSPNQSCEYLSRPRGGVGWGGGVRVGGLSEGECKTIASQLCENPRPVHNKSVAAVFVLVSVWHRVAPPPHVCGRKHICVASAGWLRLCLSDLELHGPEQRLGRVFSCRSASCEAAGCHSCCQEGGLYFQSSRVFRCLRGSDACLFLLKSCLLVHLFFSFIKNNWGFKTY